MFCTNQMNSRRFIRRSGSIVAVVVFLFCGLAAAEVPLNELLRDYRGYGLPLPTKGATLGLRVAKSGSVNGVPYKKYSLVLITRPATGGKGPTYLAGTREFVAADSDIENIEPNLQAVEKTIPDDPPSWPDQGFFTGPDLLLAIQCKAAGWDALADALYQRSKTPPSTRHRLVSGRRPTNDRAALAQIAWNHYCHEFAKMRGDRGPIVARLNEILKSPHGLNTKARSNVIADMQQTLVKRANPPAGFESDIEALLDIEDSVNWSGHDEFGFGYRLPNYEPLQRLVSAGLDAVPALLRHRDDFRVTRSMASGDFKYTWNVRIADVVAVALRAIAEEKFAYDFLPDEGRGVCIDQAHVEFWLRETKKNGEQKFLFERAIRRGYEGRHEIRRQFLDPLSQRFPNEFAKLVEMHLNTPLRSSELFDVLAECKVAVAVKTRLLWAGAKSSEPWHRVGAVRGLVKLKHPDAAKLLIESLERLPTDPEKFENSPTASLTQIVIWSADGAVWECLQKTSRRISAGQRMQIALALGHEPANDRSIEFCAGLLDEPEVAYINRFVKRPNLDDPAKSLEKMNRNLFAQSCNDRGLERFPFGDFAALQLAGLLKLDVADTANWKSTDWERFRSRVRQALAEHRMKNGAAKRH